MPLAAPLGIEAPRPPGSGLTRPLCPQQGEASQVETVSDENKSLVWVLLKQLRPGMDLSRVALPTFVLEPRSFLNKLSDYYCHADLLSRCATGRAQHPPRGGRVALGDGPWTALPPKGPDCREGLLGREGRAAPRLSGPPSQGSPAPSVHLSPGTMPSG